MSFVIGLLATIILVGFIWNFLWVLALALCIAGIMEGGAWWMYLGAITAGAMLVIAAVLDSKL